MTMFTGLGVALATPFTPDHALDLPAFRRLVRHVARAADFLVVLGSTGEAATLEEAERDALISACLNEAGGRPVVAGTGHNATRTA
ncbi:MAG TPA: dihydrodipicolinate synthase family protein, partial [Holophaga sp.]|nr:dihydrodipicolinate synthase family protein [Holophaga sp.]